MIKTPWYWQCSDKHVCVEWFEPRLCLSSAVFNGGLFAASRVFNLRVDGVDTAQPAEIALRDYASAAGWTGASIGLMTAAPMRSLRSVCAQDVEGGMFEVLVTSGLSNARRAGDPADWDETHNCAPTAGTINIILLCTHRLCAAAMAELLMLVTEAKCAALQDLHILSPKSGKIATGTGTDAVVIVSGDGKPVRWCGKHTLVGQTVARLVVEAICASVAGECQTTAQAIAESKRERYS